MDYTDLNQLHVEYLKQHSLKSQSKIQSQDHLKVLWRQQAIVKSLNKKILSKTNNIIIPDTELRILVKKVTFFF